jgi:hypothetical protein
MKPPPESKVIEELKAAEQGRRASGKWRVVVALGLLFLLICAGTLAVVEGARQSDIAAAQQEAEAEARLLQGRFAHVKNWPEWYRGRMPENWGGEEFAEWVEDSQRTIDIHHEIAMWADGLSNSEHDHHATALGEISEPMMRLFLEDTGTMQSQAQALLRFDCLSSLPDFGAGDLPGIFVIPRLQALSALVHRVHILAFLGDLDRAWMELDVVLQLDARFTRPHAIIGCMIDLAWNRMVTQAMRALCARHTPPRALLERWCKLPRLPDDYALGLAEAEAAFIAQLAGELDPDGWAEWYVGEQDTRGRFSYLDPGLDWKDRKAAFRGPAEMARFLAARFRATRRLLDDMKAGGSLRDWGMAELEYFPRADAFLFTRERGLECIEVMARTLLDEPEDHSAWVAAIHAEYPLLELRHTADGWEVNMRFEDPVKQRLDGDFATREEFLDGHPPLRFR